MRAGPMRADPCALIRRACEYHFPFGMTGVVDKHLVCLKEQNPAEAGFCFLPASDACFHHLKPTLPYTNVPLKPNGDAALYGICPPVVLGRMVSSGYSSRMLSPPIVYSQPLCL